MVKKANYAYELELHLCLLKAQSRHCLAASDPRSLGLITLKCVDNLVELNHYSSWLLWLN